jgi:transcriptional regulator with XRE-family HTH domain
MITIDDLNARITQAIANEKKPLPFMPPPGQLDAAAARALFDDIFPKACARLKLKGRLDLRSEARKSITPDQAMVMGVMVGVNTYKGLLDFADELAKETGGNMMVWNPPSLTLGAIQDILEGLAKEATVPQPKEPAAKTDSGDKTDAPAKAKTEAAEIKPPVALRAGVGPREPRKTPPPAIKNIPDGEANDIALTGNTAPAKQGDTSGPGEFALSPKMEAMLSGSTEESPRAMYERMKREDRHITEMLTAGTPPKWFKRAGFYKEVEAQKQAISAARQAFADAEGDPEKKQMASEELLQALLRHAPDPDALPDASAHIREKVEAIVFDPRWREEVLGYLQKPVAVEPPLIHETPETVPAVVEAAPPMPDLEVLAAAETPAPAEALVKPERELPPVIQEAVARFEASPPAEPEPAPLPLPVSETPALHQAPEIVPAVVEATPPMQPLEVWAAPETLTHAETLVKPEQEVSPVNHEAPVIPPAVAEAAQPTIVPDEVTVAPIAVQVEAMPPVQPAMLPVVKESPATPLTADPSSVFVPQERKAPRATPAISSEQAITLAGKTGNELLRYARDELHYSFADLLDALHKKSGLSQNLFAQSLGIDRMQYGKFVKNSVKVPPFAVMDKIAIALGTGPEEDKREWYKFIQNIPAEMNQERLNALFDMSSDHALDTESYGVGHTIALAKFFDQLGKSRGLTLRTQLAQDIAQRANADTDTMRVLRIAMDNMAGPQTNAEIDISQMTQDELLVPDHRAKKMKEEQARMIADYAFPADKARQDQVMEFLASDKYKTPDDIVSKHKSAALTRTRAAYGDNWGKRTRQPKPDTPGGIPG